MIMVQVMWQFDHPSFELLWLHVIRARFSRRTSYEKVMKYIDDTIPQMFIFMLDRLAMLVQNAPSKPSGAWYKIGIELLELKKLYFSRTSFLTLTIIYVVFCVQKCWCESEFTFLLDVCSSCQCRIESLSPVAGIYVVEQTRRHAKQ